MTTHEGGCLCGKTRYRTSGEPEFTIVCHCRTCQLRTGSAFGFAGYFKDEQVDFLSGNRKTFEFRSDESNRWIRTEFCDNCGTTLSWTLEMRPGFRAIAGGTFDEPSWHGITRQIWTRSSHDWLDHIDALPSFEKAAY